MKVNELRELLKNTDDKFSVFADVEVIRTLDITIKEICDVIDEFLTDEQKVELLELPHFKKTKPSFKGLIGIKIKSDESKMRLLNDDEFLNDMPGYYIEDIIMSLNEDNKLKILYNEKLWQEHDDLKHCSKEILKQLSVSKRIELLRDKTLIREVLKIDEWIIKEFVKDLPSEDAKLELMGVYQFGQSYVVEILTTFSDKTC